MSIRCLPIVLVLLLAGTRGFAEEERKLMVAEAVDEALFNSLAISEAQSHTAEMEAQYDAARTSRWLSLSTEGSSRVQTGSCSSYTGACS